jgi:hypothetical protein
MTTTINNDPAAYVWDAEGDKFANGKPVVWETSGRQYRGISNGGIRCVQTLRGAEYWPVVVYLTANGTPRRGTVDPATVIN